MSEKYDVVIIGAGIGGLTCGCYLAKAGLKVLIVEQHNKPGGYCTSFNRQGYRFDVGVHYLGSLKRGVLNKISHELGIQLKINIVDPSDKIIMPDNVTYIRTEIPDTIREFKKSFPRESKNIDAFFNFITKNDMLYIYGKTRNCTFLKILDMFFSDIRLKATINTLLGNVGLYAKIAAASSSIVLLKEYILDSGRYPIGGMQAFPDALVKKFISCGGTISLSEKVVKIDTSKRYKRIISNKNREFITQCIVSNADATQTFKSLIDVRSKESCAINKLDASPSMFIVYLGLKGNLKNIIKEEANVWYSTSYNIDRIYAYQSRSVIKDPLEFFQCSFPSMHDPLLDSENKASAIIFTLAPFKSPLFWDKNKDVVSQLLIKSVSRVFRGLEKYIEVKFCATPSTFYEYTLNKNGSFVGWLSTLEQSKSFLLPQRTSIEGLYLVGHWSTMGYPGCGGIPNVSYSGRRGARLILKDLGKKWKYPDITIK